VAALHEEHVRVYALQSQQLGDRSGRLQPAFTWADCAAAAAAVSSAGGVGRTSKAHTAPRSRFALRELAVAEAKRGRPSVVVLHRKVRAAVEEVLVVAVDTLDGSVAHCWRRTWVGRNACALDVVVVETGLWIRSISSCERQISDVESAPFR